MEQETRNKKQETRKSTLLLSLILLFFVQIIFSQNANSFFVEGNKLYQQEKYLEAIEQYIQIEKLDKNSFAVYYNLANAYYKTNKVAPAIYYYEKALQIEPNNKDVLVNLGFAKRMTMDNIEELPTTALQKISKNTIQKLSFN
ncbi:MAG TPA: tetratricopeptide repeat protein, partial [Flavobacteriaceae bacterium]|nr:tetratricopeptide repeat protein [Flavobacteriaceae bacterium]